jgi:hypothetical protein
MESPTTQKSKEPLPTILKQAKPTTPVITKETTKSSWTESLTSLNPNLERINRIRDVLTKT